MRKNYDLLWVREYKGLTQAEAGALVGVSRVTFTRWETGAVPIPPRKYAKLLDALAMVPRDVPRNLAPVVAVDGSKRYGARGYPAGWKRDAFDDCDFSDCKAFSNSGDVEDYILGMFEGDEFDARERVRAELRLLAIGITDPTALATEMRYYDESKANPSQYRPVVAAPTPEQQRVAENKRMLALLGERKREARLREEAEEAADPGGVKRAAIKKNRDEQEARRRAEVTAEFAEEERAEKAREEAEEVQKVLRQKRIEARAAEILAAAEEEKRFRADRKAEREAAQR